MAEGCNAPRRHGDVHIDTLNLGSFEFGFLSAARFFMMAFSGDQTAWISAILNANAFFPGSNSAATMQAALGVVQQMRQTRRSCFHFSNPRCPSCAALVTPDERHLIQMVQHVMQGRMGYAATCAMLLCEGRDSNETLRACMELKRCAALNTGTAATVS